MGFQDIVGLGGAGLDGSRQCSLDVSRRGTYEELVFTLGDHPCRGGFVERGEVSSLHFHLDGLALTGLQVLRLGEGLEFLHRLVGSLGVWCSDIELYDLLAFAVASILDGDGNLIALALVSNLSIGILEGGVA